MTLRHLTLLIAVLVLGLAPTRAFAAAPSENVSSTHTALVAAYTALHSIVATWPNVEAQLQALDRRFAAECPLAGLGSPENEPEGRRAYELTGALVGVGDH